MINKKTVLILGAGASMPYGFPSGQGLVDIICNSDSFPKNIVTVSAEVLGRNVTDFITTLNNADTESIDIFLGNNPEFEKIGKAAIAATLLPLEREPELIIKWRKLRLKHEKPKLGGHWYQYLAGLLLTNTSFDDFDKNNLSIITFNYDRSLEHYLFTKLKASFRKKTVEECAEKVSSIEIIHMYGQLGYLPWQKFDKHKIVYDMGPVDESQRISAINNAMYSIKTIGENIDENENHIKRARQLLKEATNIYVLGFGYHPFNLKILDLAHLEKGINIRGTSRGLSFQRKIELGRLDILNLKYDPERNNPRYLYDEDVYDFLYQQAILE